MRPGTRARIAGLTGEAVRSSVAGSTWLTVLGLILVTATAGFAFIDIRSVSAILDSDDTARARGDHVLSVESVGNIDARRCTALSAAAVRSGALRSAGFIAAAAVPDDPIPVYEATPGLLAILESTTTAPGLIAGPALSGELGLEETTMLRATTGEDLPVVGATGPTRSRGAPDRSLLTPVPALGRFDLCLIEFSRLHPTVTALAPFVLAESTDQVSVTTLTRLPPDRVYDPYAELRDRPTRRLQPLLPVIGALLGLVGSQLRRKELAVLRSCGFGRGALAYLLTIESAIVALGAVIIATAISAAITAGATRSVFLTSQAIRLAVLPISGFILGSALTGLLHRRATTLTALRDY